MSRPYPLVLNAFVAVLVVAAGCGSKPADDTPHGALSRFIEAMDRSAYDKGALREAYGLLDGRARAALKARARKAETLAGRRFEPWDMLAQGRFRLRFAPSQRDGMQSRIEGDRAVVTVRGSDKGGQVEVPMVREAEGWRVVLEIP